MKKLNALLVSLVISLVCSAISAVADEPETIAITLNNLDIVFDKTTGSILKLSSPFTGTMLNAAADKAGLIDAATPIEKFEPLRLASRFSQNAIITHTSDQITITWSRLGSSRQLFEQPGDVSAKVVLKANDDKNSIIMTACVENNSDVAVKQVLFPDFIGLLPFEGKKQTKFRTAGKTVTPFEDLLPKQSCSFYAENSAFVELTSGGLFDPMILRWMDFGGYKGGISLFPKRWGWEERDSVMLHLSQVSGKLRWMCAHNTDIKKGQLWNSPEYVLTPHRAGWAKGMEPYRQWVKQKVNRLYPLPKHIEEGLAFRTVWMCKNQPDDPQDAVWTFQDLPKVAQECIDHGITELVLWSWGEGFFMPVDEPFAHLGTKEDLTKAIQQCREIGVNVVPFISVLQVKKKNAAKYGVTVPDTGGYTYHAEFCPPMAPLYAHGYRCAPVDMKNPLWIKEVLESIQNIKALGATSIAWDQFWTKPDQNMDHIAPAMLDLIKKDNPQASFCGEETWNWETNAQFIDYTWDWVFNDYVFLNSAFKSPRVNYNIEHSPAEVKKAFADNVYMNIFPSKPDSINGSAYISEYPELSAALKQCAKLRKTFLTYFTEGTLIGNCILTQPCPDVHISAYVLPDRVLMILVNMGTEKKYDFACDLEPWVKSASGKYKVKMYDSKGGLIKTRHISGSAWDGSTENLQPLDIELFEFLPH